MKLIKPQLNELYDERLKIKYTNRIARNIILSDDIQAWWHHWARYITTKLTKTSESLGQLDKKSNNNQD